MTRSRLQQSHDPALEHQCEPASLLRPGNCYFHHPPIGKLDPRNARYQFRAKLAGVQMTPPPFRSMIIHRSDRFAFDFPKRSLPVGYLDLNPALLNLEIYPAHIPGLAQPHNLSVKFLRTLHPLPLPESPQPTQFGDEPFFEAGASCLPLPSLALTQKTLIFTTQLQMIRNALEISGTHGFR